MKGLLLNNIYSTLGSVRLFLILIFLMGAALFVTGNPTLFELFIYLSIGALPVIGVSGARKDAVAKWDKYEIIMPIRRNEIIQSKYLCYLLGLFAGFVIALIVTCLTLFFHGGILDIVQDYFAYYLLGASISVTIGAIFYPLIYLLGADKSEVILLISIIFSIGFLALMIHGINKTSIGTHDYTRMIFISAVVLLLYGISYLLTTSIYQHKDY